LLSHPSATQAATHIAIYRNELYAVAFELLKMIQLFVYRSPVVRETDDIYKPVKDMIGDTKPLLTWTVTDEGMAFGEAELSVYLVGVP